MWQKIWRNRLEFFPYLAIFFFWFFSSFLQSLSIKSRPGIVSLGLITIPPMCLVIIAAVRTYKTLPEKGRLPGPLKNMRSQGQDI